ncbi:Ig-like V-type domain-containing protein [Trichinella britovi]|uniref:Ig-like V-type domain-containing protein n=1 Tax=Trichinella britovi TaxID=45882 RepID=A0A0V1DHS0_TRIBR|nr:Ig-like V-type domain-containing protein [Trichinella sp. T9]KRY61095.1 Ig-like V-type domain-containing protein [Trichinella britovi]KRZ88348.1 Ig-like V-type domain-containing protein [Trichinella sp. T8]
MVNALFYFCLINSFLIFNTSAIKQHTIQVERDVYLFNRYHECLRRRGTIAKTLNAVPPEHIAALGDTIISLDCRPCPHPRLKENRKFWFYRRWSEDDIVDVPLSSAGYSDQGFVLTENYKLLLVDVNQERHGGEYICADMDGHPQSIYYLEIINNLNVKIYSPGEYKSTVYDRGILLREGPVNVVTQWSTWTSCNKCELGERRRYGECLIKPPDNMTLIRDSRLRTLLSIFPGGVSCNSAWLPEWLKMKRQVQQPMLIDTMYCAIDCTPPEKDHDITEMDENGRISVVEHVKAGFYSLREQLPPLPKPVIRQVQQVDEGASLSLYCPHGNEAVYWQRDDVFMPSAILASYTNGRAFIDEQNNLVFTSAHSQDSGFYSCWRYDGLLLLSSRLYVVDPEQMAAMKRATIGAGSKIVGNEIEQTWHLKQQLRTPLRTNLTQHD